MHISTPEDHRDTGADLMNNWNAFADLTKTYCCKETSKDPLTEGARHSRGVRLNK